MILVTTPNNAISPGLSISGSQIYITKEYDNDNDCYIIMITAHDNVFFINCNMVLLHTAFHKMMQTVIGSFHPLDPEID